MGDTESSDPANGILSGRAPYGLLVVETEPGRRVLQADPSTARIVSRIFHEYLDGRGLLAIAEGLTADGVPCPAARYCRTNEVGTAWSKGSVRSILINERYAGATGTGAGQLVDRSVFDQVQATLRRRSRSVRDRSAGGGHSFLLRGLIRCALCGRVMQANRNNGEPYYRCRYPREYASVNNIEHPRNVYLREARVLAALDVWLAVGVGASRTSRIGGSGTGNGIHALALPDSTNAEQIRTDLVAAWLNRTHPTMRYNADDDTVYLRVEHAASNTNTHMSTLRRRRHG